MKTHTEKLEEILHEIIKKYAEENEVRINSNADFEKGVIRVYVHE